MFTILCVCVCFSFDQLFLFNVVYYLNFSHIGLFLRPIILSFLSFLSTNHHLLCPPPHPAFFLSNTIYQTIHSSSLPSPNIFPNPSLVHSPFNIPTRFLHLYSTSLCPLHCLHCCSLSYTALLSLFLPFPFFPLPSHDFSH